MPHSAAVKRYLSHYLEPGIPAPPAAREWSHCIVIPVYQESETVLQQWLEQQFVAVKLLVIFVINRPSGSNADANQAFRDAAQSLDSISCGDHVELLSSKQRNDALIIDLDLQRGALPKSEAVGLARKTGCDLALLWHTSGSIKNTIIYSTDADATVPSDYFSRIPVETDNAAVFTFPFTHIAASKRDVLEATLWYEMWLHHYVLGLEFAGSPYAYHSLGSCIAISCECYAQVGGFPKRAGGEDFYLLNKANKTSKAIQLGGEPIALQARASSRAPFGTGPAVQKILQAQTDNEARLFYHPQSFTALRSWLNIIPELYLQNDSKNIETLLQKQQLSKTLAAASAAALHDLGVENAFEHCRAQGKTPAQFTKQFNQWFDGFRTLKFVHALRENGWDDLPFKEMLELAPNFWPAASAQASDVFELQQIIQQHWNWR